MQGALGACFQPANTPWAGRLTLSSKLHPVGLCCGHSPSLAALGCIFLLATVSGAEVRGHRDRGVLEIMDRGSRRAEHAVRSRRSLPYPDCSPSLANSSPRAQDDVLRPQRGLYGKAPSVQGRKLPPNGIPGVGIHIVQKLYCKCSSEVLQGRDS